MKRFSRWRFRRAPVLALIFLSGALIWWVTIPARNLGVQTLRTLDGVSRVESVRLDDRGDPHDGETAREIRQYRKWHDGPVLGRPFADALAGVLKNPRTYFGPNDNTCLFNPGVGYRLWNGQECVEVILCFHCGQMLITTKDARGKVIHTAYTEMNNSRTELLRLARETFPKDEELAQAE